MTLRPSLQPPQPADGGPPVVPPRAPRVVGAIGLLPTALAVIAEAAWVAIVAGLLQAFTRHPPVLGYPWFLAAAVAGLVAARVLEARAGGSWPAVVAALAILTGALGWLVAPEVRAILAADGLDGLGPAIAANIGGWLLAVAFVRGVAYARLPADPRRIGNVAGPRGPGPRGRRDHRRHGGGAVPRRVPRRGPGGGRPVPPRVDHRARAVAARARRDRGGRRLAPQPGLARPAARAARDHGARGDRHGVVRRRRDRDPVHRRPHAAAHRRLLRRVRPPEPQDPRC